MLFQRSLLWLALIALLLCSAKQSNAAECGATDVCWCCVTSGQECHLRLNLTLCPQGRIDVDVAGSDIIVNHQQHHHENKPDALFFNITLGLQTDRDLHVNNSRFCVHGLDLTARNVLIERSRLHTHEVYTEKMLPEYDFRGFIGGAGAGFGQPATNVRRLFVQESWNETWSAKEPRFRTAQDFDAMNRTGGVGTRDKRFMKLLYMPKTGEEVYVGGGGVIHVTAENTVAFLKDFAKEKDKNSGRDVWISDPILSAAGSDVVVNDAVDETEVVVIGGAQGGGSIYVRASRIDVTLRISDLPKISDEKISDEPLLALRRDTLAVLSAKGGDSGGRHNVAPGSGGVIRLRGLLNVRVTDLADVPYPRCTGDFVLTCLKRGMKGPVANNTADSVLLFNVRGGVQSDYFILNYNKAVMGAAGMMLWERPYHSVLKDDDLTDPKTQLIIHCQGPFVSYNLKTHPTTTDVSVNKVAASDRMLVDWGLDVAWNRQLRTAPATAVAPTPLPPMSWVRGINASSVLFQGSFCYWAAPAGEYAFLGDVLLADNSYILSSEVDTPPACNDAISGSLNLTVSGNLVIWSSHFVGANVSVLHDDSTDREGLIFAHYCHSRLVSTQNVFVHFDDMCWSEERDVDINGPDDESSLPLNCRLNTGAEPKILEICKFPFITTKAKCPKDMQFPQARPANILGVPEEKTGLVSVNLANHRCHNGSRVLWSVGERLVISGRIILEDISAGMRKNDYEQSVAATSKMVLFGLESVFLGHSQIDVNMATIASNGTVAITDSYGSERQSFAMRSHALFDFFSKDARNSTTDRKAWKYGGGGGGFGCSSMCDDVREHFSSLAVASAESFDSKVDSFVANPNLECSQKHVWRPAWNRTKERKFARVDDIENMCIYMESHPEHTVEPSDRIRCKFIQALALQHIIYGGFSMYFQAPTMRLGGKTSCFRSEYCSSITSASIGVCANDLTTFALDVSANHRGFGEGLGPGAALAAEDGKARCPFAAHVTSPNINSTECKGIHEYDTSTIEFASSTEVDRVKRDISFVQAGSGGSRTVNQLAVERIPRWYSRGGGIIVVDVGATLRLVKSRFTANAHASEFFGGSGGVVFFKVNHVVIDTLCSLQGLSDYKSSISVDSRSKSGFGRIFWIWTNFTNEAQQEWPNNVATPCKYSQAAESNHLFHPTYYEERCPPSYRHLYKQPIILVRQLGGEESSGSVQLGDDGKEVLIRYAPGAIDVDRPLYWQEPDGKYGEVNRMLVSMPQCPPGRKGISCDPCLFTTSDFSRSKKVIYDPDKKSRSTGFVETAEAYEFTNGFGQLFPGLCPHAPQPNADANDVLFNERYQKTFDFTRNLPYVFNPTQPTDFRAVAYPYMNNWVGVGSSLPGEIASTPEQPRCGAVTCSTLVGNVDCFCPVNSYLDVTQFLEEENDEESLLKTVISPWMMNNTVLVNNGSYRGIGVVADRSMNTAEMECSSRLRVLTLRLDWDRFEPYLSDAEDLPVQLISPFKRILPSLFRLFTRKSVLYEAEPYANPRYPMVIRHRSGTYKHLLANEELMFPEGKESIEKFNQLAIKFFQRRFNKTIHPGDARRAWLDYFTTAHLYRVLPMHYSDFNKKYCRPCPPGGVCKGSCHFPHAQKDFFPSAKNPNQFLQCLPGHCKEYGDCVDGYKQDDNLMCNQCSTGNWSALGTCVPCYKGVKVMFGIYVSGVCILIIGLIIWEMKRVGRSLLFRQYIKNMLYSETHTLEKKLEFHERLMRFFKDARFSEVRTKELEKMMFYQQTVDILDARFSGSRDLRRRMVREDTASNSEDSYRRYIRDASYDSSDSMSTSFQQVRLNSGFLRAEAVSSHFAAPTLGDSDDVNYTSEVDGVARVPSMRGVSDAESLIVQGVRSPSSSVDSAIGLGTGVVHDVQDEKRAAHEKRASGESKSPRAIIGVKDDDDSYDGLGSLDALFGRGERPRHETVLNTLKWRQELFSYASILGTFFQLLGLFRGVDLRWGKSAASDVLATVSSLFIFGSNCVFDGITYYDKLLVYMLFPVTYLLFMVIIFGLIFVLRMFARLGDDFKVNSEASCLSKYAQKLWKAIYRAKPRTTIIALVRTFLTIFDLVYIVLVSELFAFFNCQSFLKGSGSDDTEGREELFLFRYRHIRCNDERYNKYRPWVLICAILYGFVIPALQMAALRRRTWKPSQGFKRLEPFHIREMHEEFYKGLKEFKENKLDPLLRADVEQPILRGGGATGDAKETKSNDHEARRVGRGAVPPMERAHSAQMMRIPRDNLDWKDTEDFPALSVVRTPGLAHALGADYDSMEEPPFDQMAADFPAAPPRLLKRASTVVDKKQIEAANLDPGVPRARTSGHSSNPSANAALVEDDVKDSVSSAVYDDDEDSQLAVGQEKKKKKEWTSELLDRYCDFKNTRSSDHYSKWYHIVSQHALALQSPHTWKVKLTVYRGIIVALVASQAIPMSPGLISLLAAICFCLICYYQGSERPYYKPRINRVEQVLLRLNVVYIFCGLACTLLQIADNSGVFNPDDAIPTFLRHLFQDFSFYVIGAFGLGFFVCHLYLDCKVVPRHLCSCCSCCSKEEKPKEGLLNNQ